MTLPWICLNCETPNSHHDKKCIVCNEERYFRASEIQEIISQNPEIQEFKELQKKLTHQNKWLQTRNKNLAQENKNLQEQLQKVSENPEKTLKTSTETHSEQTPVLQKTNLQLKKTLRIWQITAICLGISVAVMGYFLAFWKAN